MISDRLAISYQLIEGLSQRSGRHLVQTTRFTGVDCCWAPVKDLEEVFSDPQVLARDMVFEMEDPQGVYGRVKEIGSPIKLSETPARRELFPPRKGEHNSDYLRSVGYTDEDIAAFIEKGVI